MVRTNSEDTYGDMDKNAAFNCALLATLFGAFVVSKTEPFATVGVMLAFIGVIVFRNGYLSGLSSGR